MAKDLTPVSPILPAIINAEHKHLTPIQARGLTLPLSADADQAAMLIKSKPSSRTEHSDA